MSQPLLKPVHSEDPHSADAGSTLLDADAGLGLSLQALRKARRLSLSDVSARLKFSTRQLDALENERWDELPKGLPLRGLVKNYARFLEADPAPLIHMLEAQAGDSAAHPSAAPPRSARREVDMPLDAEPRQGSWGWLLVILIVLLVGGFYAIERGLVPDSWLVAEWLKSIRQ